MGAAYLKHLQEGDLLLCVRWNDHFSKGHIYKVYKSGSGVLVVWCDDIQQHSVLSLDPKQFVKVED